MNNVSMKFKDNINSGKPFYSESIVTFPDGTAPLTLTPDDFVGEQGFKISEHTSNTNSFDLGSVAIGQATILLNNFDGRFDKYNFDGAVFSPTRVFTVLDDQTIEKVNKGKYTVDKQAFAGGIVSLVALNDINNFDTTYTGSFTEDTALNIVNSVALKHGLILLTQTFNNYNFHVTIPSDKKLTDRQVLNYIAQLTCNYVKLDENNYLKLAWYDIALMNRLNSICAGTFTNPATDIISAGTFENMASDIISAGTFADLGKFHHITSLYDGYSVDLDDVVITGIKVVNDSLDEFLSGAEGYVLTIQNNPLTIGKEQIIADMVANICVGMRFRPLSAPTDCNPTVQSGDIGIVEIDGNNYVTIFTNVEFNIGGNSTFGCGAESPGKNSSNRNTEATVAFLKAKAETVKQISSYDVAVKQMTNLIANAFGLHTTAILQSDGSSIYYMHNKPTIAQSSFVALANSNGFFIMKDGVPVSGWDANGNIVTNVLTAIGINAEWIKVLTSFKVGDLFSVDSLGKVIADSFESKNAKITGGTVNIATNSAPGSSSIINLNGSYKNGTATDTSSTTMYSGQYYAYEHHVDGAIETEGMSALLGGKMVCANIAEDKYLYVDGTRLNFNNTNNPNTYICQISAVVQTARINYTATGGHRFNNTVYTPDGTVSVSDRDLKNSIESLDAQKSSDFIYSLIASKFKYNNGTSDRYHHGFIAQDVKQSMQLDDWGVYIESKYTDEEDDDNEILAKGLRYEELIADLVATVQMQNSRITLQEERISKLELLVDKLIAKIEIS